MLPDTEKILTTGAESDSPEFCNHHFKLCDTIRTVRENTEKIIIGMYGSLDKCESGFIHEVRADREFTRGKITEFEGSIDDMKKLFNRTMVAIISGVISIATAASVAAVNGFWGK